MVTQKRTIPILMFSLVLILIILYSAQAIAKPSSKEEALVAATEKIETALETSPKEPNQQFPELTFYLSQHLEIQHSSKNNIVFKETGSDQLYVLFYNPLEERTSKTLYETSPSNTKLIFNKTFKKPNQFSFIQVAEEKRDEFMITVGLGGSKISTRTTLGEVPQDVDAMVETLFSVHMDK